MKEQHAQALATFLEALRETGRTFPEPVRKELHDGWQLLIFNGDRGMSIVHHGGSYDLETAHVKGTPEDWEFADSNPCTQVEGYREPADVAADVVRLFEPL